MPTSVTTKPASSQTLYCCCHVVLFSVVKFTSTQWELICLWPGNTIVCCGVLLNPRHVAQYPSTTALPLGMDRNIPVKCVVAKEPLSQLFTWKPNIIYSIKHMTFYNKCQPYSSWTMDLEKTLKLVNNIKYSFNTKT